MLNWMLNVIWSFPKFASHVWLKWHQIANHITTGSRIFVRIHLFSWVCWCMLVSRIPPWLTAPLWGGWVKMVHAQHLLQRKQSQLNLAHGESSVVFSYWEWKREQRGKERFVRLFSVDLVWLPLPQYSVMLCKCFFRAKKYKKKNFLQQEGSQTRSLVVCACVFVSTAGFIQHACCHYKLS